MNLFCHLQVSQSFGKNLGLYGDRIGEARQEEVMLVCTSRFSHPRCGRGCLSTCTPKPAYSCLEADVNIPNSTYLMRHGFALKKLIPVVSSEMSEKDEMVSKIYV